MGRGQWHARVQPQAEDQGLGGRGSTVHDVRATGRQDRIQAAQGRDVPVQPGRVPASNGTIEGMRPRPDGFVGTTPPVSEVVATLVARPRPVRDLVAAEPGIREDGCRVLVLGRGAVLVLGEPRPVAPATCAGVVGRWSPLGPVRPSASGSSSVSA